MLFRADTLRSFAMGAVEDGGGWFAKALKWVRDTWSANAGMLAVALLGIAGTFGMVAAIQTIKLGGRHYSIQWGTPFEAFAAVGTVGTLTWSVWSWYRLRREAIDEKRRDQARQIAAWLQSRVEHYGWHVRAQNNSQEPVTEVAIYLVWIQGSGYHTGEEAESHYQRLAAEFAQRRIGRPQPVSQYRAVIQLLPPTYADMVGFSGPAVRPRRESLGSKSHSLTLRANTGFVGHLVN